MPPSQPFFELRNNEWLEPTTRRREEKHSPIIIIADVGKEFSINFF